MKQTHVLILFLVVLVFAGGVLTSSVFHTASATGTGGKLSGGATLSAADSEVITLLGEIRAELVRLNAHPLRGSLTPSSVPAVPAERRREPDPSGDTVAVLREMVNELKSMSTRMASTPGTGSDLRAPAPEAQKPSIPVPGREKRDEFSRSHFFWTYQQVLDRYGRPDEIYPQQNAMQWVYRNEGSAATFTFSGGFVTQVYF